MKNIGFHGGHTIYVLGSASDMGQFFNCIHSFPALDSPQKDWSLLTDRLFMRYLRLEELDAASELMEQVRVAFASVPSSAVQWNPEIIGNPEKSLLNPGLPTLADMFAKYFENFHDAVESAKSFEQTFKIYQPVRTVITDNPDFMMEKRRPLEEYDALQGKPFWLR